MYDSISIVTLYLAGTDLPCSITFHINMKDILKIKKTGKVNNAYKKEKPRSIVLNRHQRGDIL